MKLWSQIGLRFNFDEVVTEWVEAERFAYRAISDWEIEAVNALTPENGDTRFYDLLPQ